MGLSGIERVGAGRILKVADLIPESARSAESIRKTMARGVRLEFGQRAFKLGGNLATMRLGNFQPINPNEINTFRLKK